MFMSTITLKSRITNNNTITNLWKKSHTHLKSPGITPLDGSTAWN
jgi:hypothetical protein